MKNLHLNLHKKWFDMILSGEKKEEYREVNPYWAYRLINKISKNGVNKIQSKHWWHGYLGRHGKDSNRSFYYFGSRDKESIDFIIDNYGFKDYKTITFSNGYSKNRRQFVIELLSIRVDNGKSEWGALENKKYFILQLGNIISSNCC